MVANNQAKTTADNSSEINTPQDGEAENSPPTEKEPELLKVDWLEYPEKVEKNNFFNQVDKYYPFELYYIPAVQESPESQGSSFKKLTDHYSDYAKYYRVGSISDKYSGDVYLGIVEGMPSFDTIKGMNMEEDRGNNTSYVVLFIEDADENYIVMDSYDNINIFCDKNDSHQWCDNYQETRITHVPESNITFDLEVSLVNLAKFYVRELDNKDLEFVNNNYKEIAIFSKQYESSLELLYTFSDGSRVYKDNVVDKSAFTLNEITTSFTQISNQVGVGSISTTQYIFKHPTGLIQSVYTNRNLSLRSGFPIGSSEIGYGNNTIFWEGPSQQPISYPYNQGHHRPYIDLDSISYSQNYSGCSKRFPKELMLKEDRQYSLEKDFEYVAYTNNGDKLYKFKDKNFYLFEFLYERFLEDPLEYHEDTPILSEDVSFEEFLAQEPILLQENFFGDITLIFRQDVINPVCWAEPLIYLYPEKETLVTINLDKSVDLFATDPEYKDKWTILAEPNGKLIDMSSNKRYSSLFWEGDAPLIGEPSIANLVHRTQVEDYITSSLEKLGLNENEINDFNRYWLPQMNSEDYYLIYFYDNNTVKRFVEHDINPKPDTQIRVMMDMRGYNNRFEFNEVGADYKKPVRKGFTIVEWGGIKH